MKNAKLIRGNLLREIPLELLRMLGVVVHPTNV